jgi:hypothetical protein
MFTEAVAAGAQGAPMGMNMLGISGSAAPTMDFSQFMGQLGDKLGSKSFRAGMNMMQQDERQPPPQMPQGPQQAAPSFMDIMGKQGGMGLLAMGDDDEEKKRLMLLRQIGVA